MQKRFSRCRKQKPFYRAIQTAPFIGFPAQTKFQLVQDNAPNPDIITDMFRLKVDDVLLNTAKILGGGYDGQYDPHPIINCKPSRRLNVSATAEGLRVIF